MAKVYVVQFTPGAVSNQYAFLTAGSQGLTVVEVEVTCNGTPGTSFSIERVATSSIVGGSPEAMHPLDESDPLPLSTALVNAPTWTATANLGAWWVSSPTSQPVKVCQRFPIRVAPGGSLVFVGNSPAPMLNVYFEE
jgi:hypothetical protein